MMFYFSFMLKQDGFLGYLGLLYVIHLPQK